MLSPKPIANGQQDKLLTWPVLSELLDTEQYQAISECLETAYRVNQEQGFSTLAHILRAAQQITRACSQSQDEVKWHEEARAQAERRKQELEQLLCNILRLLGDEGLAELASQPQPVAQPLQSIMLPDTTPDSQRTLKLWQRVQQLLRSKTDLAGSPHANGFVALKPETTFILQDDQPALVIYLLGTFEVYQNDQMIATWVSRKGKSIFKYLIMHRTQHISKEVLMTLFWPEADAEAARNNLNVAIYSLRQTLRYPASDFSHILFQDDCYFINPDLQIWADMEIFQEYVKQGRQLEDQRHLSQAMSSYTAADSLYSGILLPEDNYEDWLMPYRQRFQDIHFDLLDRIGRYYLSKGNYAACLAACQKILAVDPCREDAHVRLMECYQQQGQHYLALRQYHLCQDILKREFDTDPMPSTTAFYQRIKHKGLN